MPDNSIPKAGPPLTCAAKPPLPAKKAQEPSDTSPSRDSAKPAKNNPLAAPKTSVEKPEGLPLSEVGDDGVLRPLSSEDNDSEKPDDWPITKTRTLIDRGAYLEFSLDDRVDLVEVEPWKDGGIRVRANGFYDTFTKEQAKKLVFLLKGGDDTFVASDKVEVPLNVRGGPGKDRIRGGSGPDTIRGGPDKDIIHGGKGDDRLDGGRGEEDLVFGEEGRDTFVRDDADVTDQEACEPTVGKLCDDP